MIEEDEEQATDPGNGIHFADTNCIPSFIPAFIHLLKSILSTWMIAWEASATV